MYMILTGLGMGILFGYALQRGRFCVNTAFRDILISRDFTLFKAYFLAILIQMLLVNLLAEAKIIYIRMAPFFWLASIIGGFTFGFGIVLAGGCASGSWYRVGEGMLGSWLAIFGFSLGGIITVIGIVRSVFNKLRDPIINFQSQPSLPELLKVEPWIVIVIILIAGFFILKKKSKKSSHEQGWSWEKTGIVIGIVGTLSWIIGAPSGWEYGLSITQPTRSIIQYLIEADPVVINWGTFLVLGIPIGSLIASKINKEFNWRAPKPTRLLQSFGGGLIMGFGANVAGGCNIGHGLTGMSILALSSITTTVFIVLGVWTAVYLLFLRG